MMCIEALSCLPCDSIQCTDSLLLHLLAHVLKFLINVHLEQKLLKNVHAVNTFTVGYSVQPAIIKRKKSIQGWF